MGRVSSGAESKVRGGNKGARSLVRGRHAKCRLWQVAPVSIGVAATGHEFMRHDMNDAVAPFDQVTRCMGAV